MLAFLQASGRLTDRKFLLLACAAVRGVWPLLTEAGSRRAVEASEGHADGLADAEGLRAAVLDADKAARKAARAADQCRAARQAAEVARRALARAEGESRRPAGREALERARQAARGAAERAERLAALAEATSGPREAARAAALCVRAAWYRSRSQPGAEISLLQAMAAVAAGNADPERPRQCMLLRDLFGSPFRPRPVLSPSWLSWKDGAVVKLARGMYAERSFDRLPVLADALEEAGCTEHSLLAHCRSEGEHVRGCWVVDLLLGKG
jgi:hypothetical protein